MSSGHWTRVGLERGESIIMEARESPGLQWSRYLLTLGAYEFWRRAKVITLTDRRLIICAGRVTKRDRSLPLARIQDVNVISRFGFGRVAVSTAGGSIGSIGSPWMASAKAREIASLLNASVRLF